MPYFWPGCKLPSDSKGKRGPQEAPTNKNRDSHRRQLKPDQIFFVIHVYPLFLSSPNPKKIRLQVTALRWNIRSLSSSFTPPAEFHNEGNPVRRA